MTPQTDDAISWRGRTAVDRDGEKLGTIDEIYLDADTGKPEWLAVKTGLFGTKLTFIPLAEATSDGDEIRVPYEKSLVKDAPSAEADGALSQDEEASLYRHYDLEYGERRSDSGLPEGGAGTRTETETDTGSGTDGDASRTDGDASRTDGDASRTDGDASRTDGDDSRTTGRGPVGEDVSGPETDEAMTRSEEEVRVGTTQREAGRARLRKYIVTEEVTQSVPVQREEVRIEREPITDANRGEAVSGGDLTEEEHEVTLHAEEAVVEKNVVPKERVRLDKDTITEEQQVSEEVRKEEIEIDGADEAGLKGR